MNLLIKNIGQLLQVRNTTKALLGDEMNRLPLIKNAYLIIKNGKIFDFGNMKEMPAHEGITILCLASKISPS